jgi:hypothetical protein
MIKKPIIKLNGQEARKVFLESEAYCNIDLPEYVNFSNLLKEVENYGLPIDLKKTSHNDTSYIFYNNKDGKYAWRKFQLVHPVLYVELVNLLTDNWIKVQDHFKDNKADKIFYGALYQKKAKHKKQKKTQILSYIDEIEKESIKTSLYFNYMSKLDITDCYPSVYTHSIPWALHGKIESKNKKHHKKLSKNKTK